MVPITEVAMREMDCSPLEGRSGGGQRLRAGLGVLIALTYLTLAPTASAYHIPGATYTGTHAGGGTVSFTLTADGSGLTNFNIGGPVSGNVCTFSGSSITFAQPLPISGHAFSSSSGTTTVSGSFAALQQASGTFRIKTFPPLSCDSGTVSWTARTTASPTGSEECKNATAAVNSAGTKVKAAEKALKKAQKALKNASTASAKTKAKTRVKKARARLKAAKRAREQAEQAATPVCG